MTKYEYITNSILGNKNNRFNILGLGIDPCAPKVLEDNYWIGRVLVSWSNEIEYPLNSKIKKMELQFPNIRKGILYNAILEESYKIKSIKQIKV